ncbi:MAG TPA: hypothetical protein VFI25_02970 [Planctomycetota bacterium]|jgi:hypothetical protein|nr:hypothetical protein [Planctomycetota bacterium]
MEGKSRALLGMIALLSPLAAPVRSQPCPAVNATYAVSTTPPSLTSILGGPATFVVFSSPNDDGMGPVTAIAFPFSHFGLPKTSFQVSANGFVAFDAALGAGYFTNSPLPSTVLPNDTVAPWWDDLYHFAAGASTVWTLAGAPGSQQLIVEWSGLEHYTGNGSGENVHFQLVLNEAGGTIEFHYDGGTFAAGTDPWTATIGAESILAIYGVDATGGGTANATFPATDLLLTPAPAAPVTLFSYAASPSPAVFPSVIGTPGAVPVFATPQDNGISPPAPIGFPFSFFGIPKTSFQVSANGFVAFDQAIAGGIPGNSAPGTAGLPNDYAAPWWDDLVHFAPTAASAYLVAGPPGSRTLTVEWRDLERAPGNGSGENVHFAAVFFEGTNLVEFHYDPATFASSVANPWNATVGLENATGSRGVDVTGGGTANANLPADVSLDPCDCGFDFPFGTGCPTSAGPVPSIASSGGSPNSPNATYAITLSGAPAGAPVLLLIGGSNATWLGFPLPLPLSAFGGSAACNLRVSLDVTVSTVASPSGTASVTIPLGASLLCLGAAYAQWAVVDLGIPGLPIATSNALAANL